MRSYIMIVKLVFIMALLFSMNSCLKDSPVSEEVSDAQKVTALKKVTLSFDSLGFEIGMPAGALSGKSFSELRTADSALYSDKSNYTITFTLNMTADNSDKDARDAKFDGILVEMVLDTISLSPVDMEATEFEVARGESQPVAVVGDINGETHGPSMKYIFRRTVDGKDLATTLSLFLKYQVGVLAGDVALPDIKKDIPTRATPEMKSFLSGLLDSGVLDG
ncbi:MAG: hypothetical protein HQK83_02925 [Fibrobacteria bacterium]|nr:hypothetical protein [Fibrobacteria bacterium]